MAKTNFLFLISILTVLAFCLPQVSAITLQDTSLYSSGINLNTTIGSSPVYCDVIDVNESYQNLTNCRLNEADVGKNLYFTSSGVISLWTYISEMTVPCSSFTQSGVSILTLLSALLLPVGILGLLYFKGSFENVTLGTVIVVFMVIVVGIALFIVSMQNLGGVC